MVIFPTSSLYHAGVRAMFESLAKDCFGLCPGQYRSETRAQTTRKRLRSAAFMACTAAAPIFS